MLAETFYRTVTMDQTGFLDELISLLDGSGTRYCAIGGQAVSAYVEPLVGLDLDLVIAAPDLDRLVEQLRRRTRSRRSLIA